MKLYKLIWPSLTLLLTERLSAQSYVPEFANREMKIAPAVKIDAYPFDIKEVRLLDGPFKEAMEADARYLLVIEPDRLLSDFRTHAGLKAKGERYGGWESSGLAGHSLGHYLSACALQYASTDDKRYLERVNYIVDELALCQNSPVKGRGDGYVGAIPREDSLWMEIAAGQIRSRGFDLNGAWSPWYTVHKIMAGLLDAYLYCGNAKALQIEKKMADWTGTIVDKLPDSLLQKMLFCEYGGMNDVLVNTYSLTGNKKYLDMSYKFHDKRILDSLSLGLDVLAGKHSNTQIPKVIGCARRYELTGSEKDRDISEFFWATIVNNYSYATGGNSNYEYLGQPHRLNDQLTDNTTETCNTYNMLKLTRHLFAWHPKASLMDYYERGLYNHILASQNHDDGMMCYFVPLRMGTRKEYSDSFNTFTCCVGSGMENHVKYGESIYYRGKDGSLYINLFIPSRLNWKEKGITLEQRTQLPSDDKVSLLIGVQKPATFSIRIRKPYWAGKGMTVKVNGAEQQNYAIGTDGYIILNRLWKAGDKIEMTLPESIHTVAMPDNPGRIALFYGPVILAGVLGQTEPDPVKGIPVLVTKEKDPNKWVRKEGTDRLVFRAALTTGQRHNEMKKMNEMKEMNEMNETDKMEVEMIPFNRTKNEYYSVYWDFFTPETWAVQQDKYQEEKKKKQELEDRTVDKLRLGEMQPERDHSFTGESLNTGEEHGQKWRSAEEGGSFSFVMKVDSPVDHALICSYWGSDHRGRIFDIQIDGQTIATQDLNGLKESKFYEMTYPVSKDLVKGKDKVLVTFKAKTARNSVGPVFGTIRLVTHPRTP